MGTIPELLIFDGHNDTLLNLSLPHRGGGRNFFERDDRGHIDLPHAREGKSGGGFFAIFAPSNPDPRFAPGSDLTITESGYEVRLAPPLDLASAQSMTIAMTARLFRLRGRIAWPVARGQERCRADALF